MNQHWIQWMLGGALAASLAWHLVRPTANETRVESCEMLALDRLELSDSQRDALSQWQAQACASSACAGDAATERLGELERALRDPGTSPERLRELAAEVSSLRAQALSQCVDSVVAVREILSREQLDELMDACCSQGACATR